VKNSSFATARTFQTDVKVTQFCHARTRNKSGVGLKLIQEKAYVCMVKRSHPGGKNWPEGTLLSSEGGELFLFREGKLDQRERKPAEIGEILGRMSARNQHVRGKKILSASESLSSWTWAHPLTKIT